MAYVEKIQIGNSSIPQHSRMPTEEEIGEEGTENLGFCIVPGHPQHLLQNMEGSLEMSSSVEVWNYPTVGAVL
jgi:hypothetical protein